MSLRSHKASLNDISFGVPKTTKSAIEAMNERNGATIWKGLVKIEMTHKLMVTYCGECVVREWQF